MEIKNSTEEIIISAAIKVFAAGGFAGARVDKIAEISKVNKAMIYYHFKSKDGLYRAIITRFDEELLKVVKTISELDCDSEQKIYEICNGVMDYLSNIDDDIKRIIFWELASGAKVIKEIKIHKLIFPMLKMIYEVYAKAKKDKKINDVNPVAAHLMIVGTAVFANMIRFVINDKLISSKVLGGGFPKDFMNDVMKIFKHGIARS